MDDVRIPSPFYICIDFKIWGVLEVGEGKVVKLFTKPTKSKGLLGTAVAHESFLLFRISEKEDWTTELAFGYENNACTSTCADQAGPGHF